MNAPVFSNYFTRSIGLALVLICAGAAHARVVEDLYVGEATVTDAARVDVEAQLLALDEVLFRLTGEEDLRARLSVSATDLPLLIQSRQVIQKRWRDVSDQWQTGLAERVEFDPVAIDQRLMSANVPKWGAERASVLVWAVIDEGSDSQLLDDPIAERAMTDAARVYGLDLVRPLADALDLADISIADIRGGFLDQLTSGLTRYEATVGVMLDLRTDGENWLSRVAWRIDGVDGGQSFIGQSVSEVLNSSFRGLLRAMVRRYAADPSSAGIGLSRLRVLNISESVQYAEVLNYLRSLSVVESVRLTKAGNSQLEFEVVLRGTNLNDVLSVGQTLEVVGVHRDGFIELQLK